MFRKNNIFRMAPKSISEFEWK